MTLSLINPFKSLSLNYCKLLQRKVNLVNQVCSFHPSVSLVDALRRNSNESVARLEKETEGKLAKAFGKCRYKRLIKAATRDKGQYVEHNPRLAKLIEVAKAHGISDEIIDHSVNVTLDVRAKVGMCEMIYPGRGYFVAEIETVPIYNVHHTIIEACKSYDAQMLNVSRRLEYYEPAGIIVIAEKLDGGNVESRDKEKLSVKDVHSVNEEVDLNGKTILQVTCDSFKLMQMKHMVENLGFVVEEAFVGLVPKTAVQFSDNAKSEICNFLSQLSDIPEVHRLYHNVASLS